MNNNNNNNNDYPFNFDMNLEYFSDYQEPQNYYEQGIVSPRMSNSYNNNSNYNNNNNSTNNFPLYSTQRPANNRGDESDDNVDDESTPTSGKSVRANFSVHEDQTLISAFIRVFEDSIVGTNQNKGVFWHRV